MTHVGGVPRWIERQALADQLGAAGFVAAQEEAGELLAYAASDGAGLDDALLDEALIRRLAGEPLAWITGTARFCGSSVRIDPGLYVPRWQSEPLVRRAIERLPGHGTAIDICTGTGAIARVLATARPGAQVVASDMDPRSVRCATRNGVRAYLGDLFEPLPRQLLGRVDVVVGVVPYVPTNELAFLPRDTLTFESPGFYDGGDDGTEILRRSLAEGRQFLRPGGVVLLELGGRQAELLAADLAHFGYLEVDVLVDEDGDVRGIEATFAPAEGRDPIQAVARDSVSGLGAVR